jgi:hypothetical protein
MGTRYRKVVLSTRAGIESLMRASRIPVAVCTAVLFVGATVFAQQAVPPPTEDVTALAKKTQNPVGDVTTVPFQFNFNTGGDLHDQTLFNLNIQPVIPFKVSDGWSIIDRTIVPINSVPAPDGTTRYSGVGDIEVELFVTPATPKKIIWGAGPLLSLPTSTVTGAATGAWGLGPAVVVASMRGRWVLGALLTQTWTMAHADTYTEINQLLFQPFVNYNFGQGWALSFSPVVTAKWNAKSGEQWTVPLGLGITRTTVFDGRPMSLGVQYYNNVERPQGTPGQLIRFSISLLYPKK